MMPIHPNQSKLYALITLFLFILQTSLPLDALAPRTFFPTTQASHPKVSHPNPNNAVEPAAPGDGFVEPGLMPFVLDYSKKPSQNSFFPTSIPIHSALRYRSHHTIFTWSYGL